MSPVYIYDWMQIKFVCLFAIVVVVAVKLQESHSSMLLTSREELKKAQETSLWDTW